MNAALNASDRDCLAAALWHQRESDRPKFAAYEAAWTEMVTTLRDSNPAAENVPVVLGELTPYVTENSPGYWKPINDVLRGIPDNHPFTALAPSHGLESNEGGDNIHLSAACQRRYAERY